MAPDVQPLRVTLPDGGSVSALLLEPRQASACYIMAHGAGAGMGHPFLASLAIELGSRAIATLRFQFPYMEFKAKRPDPPRVAQATVRSAIAEASARLPGLLLFAGGKSFGGRMTSQAQAAVPLEGVEGLIFLGFPLHPANKPSAERGAHLHDVHIPMLFLQGDRDALAELDLLMPLLDQLADRAQLHVLPHADHSFRVAARSGGSNADIMREIADAIAGWIDKLLNAR
jgi:uncharacterized protein